jgi:hypothetical protein
MFSKQATPSPDENNNEAARKPSDVETAVEKLNQVTGARTQPGPQGGLQSLVNDLNEARTQDIKAWSDGLQYSPTQQDAVMVEEPKYVAAEVNIVRAESEASLKLADTLSGKPNTPEIQAHWLSLMQNLEPGPYTDYMLQKVGDLAAQEGPVRDHLLTTLQSWREEYGPKGMIYELKIAQLDRVLHPQPSFFERLKGWLS